MESQATYEFWEHGQSGEVFAIRLNRTGRRITGMRGPLFSNQLYSARLADQPYDEDPSDLAWVEKHRDNWTLSEHQSPPRYY